MFSALICCLWMCQTIDQRLQTWPRIRGKCFRLPNHGQNHRVCTQLKKHTHKQWQIHDDGFVPDPKSAHSGSGSSCPLTFSSGVVCVMKWHLTEKANGQSLWVSQWRSVLLWLQHLSLIKSGRYLVLKQTGWS